MDEKLAFPQKKVLIKTNNLKSFWISKKDIKEIPKSIKPGDFIKIYSKDGKFLASGYINLNSKIPIRIFDTEEIRLNYEYIKCKIFNAFLKRKHLENITDSYRIVHSEGDFLPGLIIDKYSDVFVIQINTAGMENLRQFILNSIIELFNPKAIFEKSDEKLREIEGLLSKNGLIYGEKIDEITITEQNVKFLVDFSSSQKTGFYLDQRENRNIVSEFAKDKKVLDLFSHTGGFGIYCKIKGANFVKFVEISENICKLIQKNLKLNGINGCEIVNEDAFNFLTWSSEKFDLIIIDPPSFTKSIRNKKEAIKGYKFLISSGLSKLNKDGIMAVFSCSYHINLNDLIQLTSNFRTQILKILTQDIDHPIIPSIPQTFYLKGLLLKKL